MSKLVHTYKTKNFAAIIVEKDGKKAIKMFSRDWYLHEISKYKTGEHVTVTVTSKKPKRTIAQNSYYWGVYLRLISKETGEDDIDGLHELFKGKFLTKGIREILGEKVRKKGSTTELSVSDFCEYILAIEELTKVKAPPTESYELAPLK